MQPARAALVSDRVEEDEFLGSQFGVGHGLVWLMVVVVVGCVALPGGRDCIFMLR